MDRTPSLGRALLGLAVLVAIVVAGFVWLASASDEAEPEREASPDTSDVITFIRSGGFTGAITTLTLSEDGSGTLSGDAVDDEEVPVSVGEGRMRDLLAEMDDVWPESSGPVNSGDGCADCPIFGITFRDVEVTIHGIPPKRFQEPVDVLTRIMDREGRS